MTRLLVATSLILGTGIGFAGWSIGVQQGRAAEAVEWRARSTQLEDTLASFVCFPSGD